MILLMRNFRARYNEWTSSLHLIFIVPAQSATNLIRSASKSAGAEIINLGIVEKKVDGKEAGEKLAVDECYISYRLRRPAPVLYVICTQMESITSRYDTCMDICWVSKSPMPDRIYNRPSTFS
jgi:hypothetical protein